LKTSKKKIKIQNQMADKENLKIALEAAREKYRTIVDR